MKPFKLLARSRKVWISAAVIIVNVVLLATGQIGGELATTAISGALVALVGAIAYEDGKEKGAGRRPGE